MDNEKPLSESESLELIASMIKKTKDSLHDNGFYFLLWGWLVFIASITQYVMIKMNWPEESNYTWAILMPLGGIVMVIRKSGERKKQKVKTYASETLKFVSYAFMISLFIVIYMVSKYANWSISFPLIMMVYGMWLFISGGVLKFKPLVIGGLINFACSIAGFYIKTIELIPLLSFAVLAGYIIPGYLLNAKFKRENNETV